MSVSLDVPAQRALKPRRRRKRRVGDYILDVVLLIVALLMIAPLWWLFAASLSTPGEAFTVPPTWIPNPISFENFATLTDLIPIGQMAINSIIVAVISVGGSLLFSSMAAYAFSRVNFPARTPILVGMLSALMIPPQLVVIPVFVMFRYMGLIDTLAALWLPALINVFAIFFLRQYFNSIPRDLDDAARLDGASHAWILFRMLVPLSAPALSALAILGFQASWNNYFGPLIFIVSTENMTLPLGLVTLSAGQGGGPAPVLFAAIALVVFPVLVIFLIFQRYFVSSIATAGIRG